MPLTLSQKCQIYLMAQDYNPYHDENGRFSGSEGGKGGKFVPNAKGAAKIKKIERSAKIQGTKLNKGIAKQKKITRSAKIQQTKLEKASKPKESKATKAKESTSKMTLTWK